MPGPLDEAGLYWAAGEDVDPSEVADTAMSMTMAVDRLTAAAGHAAQCGSLAATAQRHIAGEAHRVEVRLTAHRSAAGLTPPPPTAEDGLPEDWIDDREWLTLEEAAEVVGVAVSTLGSAQWRRDYSPDLVPERGTRRRLLFRRGDLVAVRDQRRGKASAA